MNTVLITAGIDDFTRKFHELPGNPIAIIELDDWTFSQKLKRVVRRFLQLVNRDRFDSVSSYCRDHNLHYYAVPCNRKQLIQAVLDEVSGDLVVTYCCPLIPVKYLSRLSVGAVNLHDSLLPDYRGGDPLFWQVLHGVEQTGITIHKLADKFDSGPILKRVVVERPRYLAEKDLAYLLNVTHGYAAVCETLEDLLQGRATSIEQPMAAEAPTAPNGARNDWQKLAADLALGESAIRDLKCFLGISEHSQ